MFYLRWTASDYKVRLIVFSSCNSRTLSDLFRVASSGKSHGSCSHRSANSPTSLPQPSTLVPARSSVLFPPTSGRCGPPSLTRAAPLYDVRHPSKGARCLRFFISIEDSFLFPLSFSARSFFWLSSAECSSQSPPLTLNLFLVDRASPFFPRDRAPPVIIDARRLSTCSFSAGYLLGSHFLAPLFALSLPFYAQVIRGVESFLSPPLRPSFSPLLLVRILLSTWGHLLLALSRFPPSIS